jgi:hypothetical protein
MVPILDTDSAERNFEEQLCAMFTFFESSSGIPVGNFFAEGQIDSEFVATRNRAY